MIDEKDLPTLKNIGVKDSKLISPKKRGQIAGLAKKAAKGYELIEIQPAEIDSAVESENTNLNWLEAEKAAMLLNKLNPDIAIIDCPSPNIKAYRDFIMQLLKKKDMELILEHKAERHLPVAAASIIAKVTRDARIEEIKKKIGAEFGSGYPSDPKTKEFIQKEWKAHGNIMRKSWATYKAISQKSLKEF